MFGNVDNKEESFARAKLVDQLAHAVVEVLNTTPSKVRRAQLAEAVDIIYRAACKSEAMSVPELLDELRGLRIKEPSVIEDCIGEAARRLGEDWLADRRGFADVALASSRLLDLCGRTLRNQTGHNATFGGQSLIVATIYPEMHLIGPAILANRLRRLGHSVSIMCNVSAEAVSDKLSSDQFDGVMISCASQSGLESVIATIKHLRKTIEFCPPIALGGPVVEFIETKDALSIGADLITTDEKAALVAFETSMHHLRIRAAL